MISKNTDNDAPIVSFIIPYHNEPVDMLRECVDSMIRLSLKQDEREIIIIDDGSDYCPINELDDIKDHIIYVRQKNSGLSAARNRGLDIASGQFIQFVDADDFLISWAYDQCLDIVRYETPEIVQFEHTGSMPNKTAFQTDTVTDGANYLKNYNLKASACSYLFKRALLGDMRFIKGLLHEDEDFTPVLFLKAERLYHTNAKAYFYRKHKGSITTKRDPRHVIKRMNDIESIIVKLNNKAASLPQYEALALQRRVAQLTMDYLYGVIVATKSQNQLEHRIERLTQLGLFPLPDKKYSKKYTMFRKMTNSAMGRSLLIKSAGILSRLA